VGADQKIAQIVKYGSGFLGLIPFAGPAVEEVAKAVAGQFASQSLEQERARIIEIMRGATRKVVVLIDDIDRLDREEILTLLKLVRLAATFLN
jgi:hypothetical protein